MGLIGEMGLLILFAIWTVAIKATQEVVEGLQAEQHKEGTEGRENIHACSTSQSDGCRHPDAGRCGESTNGILLENDGSGSDEANATDHLCCDARDIKTMVHPMTGRDTVRQRSAGL